MVVWGGLTNREVTAQFYLASKGKYILEAWGQTSPKEGPQYILASSFYLFVSFPLGLPYANWVSQEVGGFVSP